jgi:penicillin-binding protein 1A
MDNDAHASIDKHTDRPARAKKPRWRPTRWWWINVVGSVVIALFAADQVVEWAIAQVPLPKEVKLPSTSEVYDRDGNLISTYRDEVTRFIIDTSTLPDHVSQAVISAEDRDFFGHEGISLGGTIRAAWANVTSGEVVQGGSTITQQYIKNAVLEDPTRSLDRKLKEAILSIKLERQFSKQEILEMYLNTVYFGRGAYGIEAAARVYFNKHAQRLTIPESAFLAGLIPAPARYESKDSALQRRSYVLKAMNAEGYISESRLRRAEGSKLKIHTASALRSRHQPAAYFLEWLRKEYLYPYFGDCLYQCGLKIHTTIDMEMQAEAERVIAETLNEKSDPQAALVTMTPKGRVRAMVGSRKDFTSVRRARGFNYAADSKRQAGSAFKPFTLLAAIEEDISPQSYFSGHSPKTIEDPACTGPKGIWEPENYGAASYGTMDLTTATANSVNTIFAELISEIGPENVAELVEKFGFSGTSGKGNIEPVCSLALGTLDVSVLEMTRAYAAFAARGRLPDVIPIHYVENRRGRCILGFGAPKKLKCKKNVDIEGKQVVDENSADVLNQALEGVVEGGTATAAQIGRPVAGKTGTTQDNRDAWFAGYTPQLATVVWMGYPIEPGRDKKPGTGDEISPLMHYCYEPEICRPVHGIEVTGGSFPATMWGQFMSAVLEDVDLLYFPEPIDMPDIILNPPPPPPPPEPVKEKKEEDPGGEDGGGDTGSNGNGNGNGNGGD